jgi:ferredoxin-NADP reductase
MVTAKVKCTAVEPVSDGQVAITIGPDYDDGRNKEWAKYTPGLNFTMTVKEEVAGHFEAGRTYTLQFVPSED